MLATQARVRFWQEMKERHAGVSAIACRNQDAHARSMALHVLPPEPRPRSLAGRRVASAAGPAKRPDAPRSAATAR